MCTSLFSLCSLVADVSIWATSPLGAAVRRIFRGFGFFFPSQLCCTLRFQNSPQTCGWEDFLVFGNFSSFTTPSLGRVSGPNSFVSLFVFYILSYLLSKRMGFLSGCLVSSVSFQKLFCGSCSAFKWSFDEFVGEKVVPILFLCHLGTAITQLLNSSDSHEFKVTTKTEVSKVIKNTLVFKFLI